MKTQVDIEFVAEEIFSSIKGIDPYECWVISGSKKLGKNKGTLNEAVASITFDEVMNKHNVQMEDYYKEGRSDLEIQYLKALLKGIDHYLLNHKSVLYSLIEHSAMEFLAIAETDWKFRHWKEEEECRQSFYDYVKKYHVNWESFFDDVEFEEGED